MRLILERINHPIQSEFIPQHVIHNIVLLTHDVMNTFKHVKGKKRYVSPKLDVEKSYNRVE